MNLSKQKQAQIKRWSEKPNRGISRWNIGQKRYRVTLTDGQEQITLGYTYTFEEAKQIYFNAYYKRFSEYPTGEYSEDYFLDGGR